MTFDQWAWRYDNGVQYKVYSDSTRPVVDAWGRELAFCCALDDPRIGLWCNVTMCSVWQLMGRCLTFTVHDM